MTREEKNKKQREMRRLTGNKNTLKYEKTKNGFLMRLYRNMKSRVSGVQYLKAHLYFGKELLDKNTFYIWAKNNKKFHKMFFEWEKSNYNRKLTPTVDRIDSSKGYFIENMRWLTHSENSILGNISKRKSKKCETIVSCPR